MMTHMALWLCLAAFLPGFLAVVPSGRVPSVGSLASVEAASALGADVAISLLEEDGDVVVTGANGGIAEVKTAAPNLFLLSEAEMEEDEMEDASKDAVVQGKPGDDFVCPSY